MRFTIRPLLLLVAATVFVASAPLAARAQEVRIVVNAANPETSISHDEVARLFLKKVTTWKSGKPVAPVDQSEASAVRAVFCRQLLGKDIAAVKAYWQQAIFTGRGSPPPQKATDDEVLAFVAANPNAVGYVSAGATLPAGVKAVTIAN